MRCLVGFVLFLLALGTGCGEHLDECEKRGLDCNDRNECTWDGCQVLWCAHGPVEDATPCTGGLCLDGECVEFDDTLPCTEEGIRLAIAVGGGPHTFDCDSSTTVVTQAEIEVDNDVILDGEGNLIVESSSSGRPVFSVRGVTAELMGMIVTGGTSGIQTSGTLTLTNSTVSGSRGSGIHASGTLTVTNSTVSGNSETGIANSGTMVMTNSTVSGNSRNGITNFGTLTVTNSTVSGNSETGVISNGTTMAMTNCTVSGNSGGSIAANGGTSTLTGTIVDGDCTSTSPDTLVSYGYNIESPGNTCGFDQTGDQSGVSADDLKLGGLADNGGPTATHALEGTVGVDVIPEAECLDAEGVALTTDQRGFPRDSMCDVGAFEAQP